VKEVNRKILILSLACVTFALLAPLVKAQGPTSILTAWTDQPQYSPGQAGTLYVTYNNARNDPVEIRNITVVFAGWWAYTSSGWVGNLTYVPTDTEKTINGHAVHTFQVSFTVPSDGRAVTTVAEVTVNTNLASPDYLVPGLDIVVSTTPAYMTTIINLFTVQVVLLIICTIIIAAAIFLSGRRPPATWKTEEKLQ
jgi:hypothetical protein